MTTFQCQIASYIKYDLANISIVIAWPLYVNICIHTNMSHLSTSDQKEPLKIHKSGVCLMQMYSYTIVHSCSMWKLFTSNKHNTLIYVQNLWYCYSCFLAFIQGFRYISIASALRFQAYISGKSLVSTVCYNCITYNNYIILIIF